ncbi:MAG: hypothetical protein AABX94_02550, partial [Nanoarchaeota archaeon]
MGQNSLKKKIVTIGLAGVLAGCSSSSSVSQGFSWLGPMIGTIGIIPIAAENFTPVNECSKSPFSFLEIGPVYIADALNNRIRLRNSKRIN